MDLVFHFRSLHVTCDSACEGSDLTVWCWGCRCWDDCLVLWEQRYFITTLKYVCGCWRIKDQIDVTSYFISLPYVLNMFRTLIYLSSGACDFAVELPHRLLCSRFVVCRRFGAAGFSLQHGHHSNPAAPNLRHTTNREHNNRCGNSTAKSQAPDDGYINVRNILST